MRARSRRGRCRRPPSRRPRARSWCGDAGDGDQAGRVRGHVLLHADLAISSSFTTCGTVTVGGGDGQDRRRSGLPYRRAERSGGSPVSVDLRATVGYQGGPAGHSIAVVVVAATVSRPVTVVIKSTRPKTTSTRPSSTPSRRPTDAATDARSKSAQMTGDAAAPQGRRQGEDRQANSTAGQEGHRQRSQPEADALDAIDYACWTLYTARLAMLDAIDACVYTDERARLASHQ